MKSIKLFLATTSLAFLIAFLGGCGKQADFAFDYDPYEKEKILFKLFTEQAVYEMGDDQTFRISQNRYLIYDDVSVAPVRYGMIRLEKGKVHLTNFNKDPFFTLSIDENDQVLLRSKKQTILLKPDFTETFYQPQNIFEAIKWGDMKDVDRLVLTGESLDDANALGMYPLMTAIYYDNYPIIQYLVLAGVDLLAQNYSSMTALHIALKEKNKEVIQLLLANGAKEQFYPCKELMPVLPKDDFSIVKLMVDAGFDPSCQESTILFSLLSQKKMEGSKQLENLNYLLSKQINTNVNALEGGDTPLMRAAAYGNAAMVQRLIDHGVDLFSEDKKGQTALDYVNLYTSNADQNIDAILKAAGLNTGIKAKADQEYSNAMKLLHQGRALEAYWKMVDLSNTYKQKRFYLARIKAGMQIEKPTLIILKDLVTMYDRFHEKKSYTSYLIQLGFYKQMIPLVNDDASKLKDGSFKEDSLLFVLQHIDKLYDKLLRYRYTLDNLYEKYLNLKQMGHYAKISRRDLSNGRKTRFVGESLSGRPFGKGALKYADGSSYYGVVIHFKRHGQGKMTYKDGTLYDGMWKNNKRNGKGFYTDRYKTMYLGTFKDDKLVGVAKVVRPGRNR